MGVPAQAAANLAACKLYLPWTCINALKADPSAFATVLAALIGVGATLVGLLFVYVQIEITRGHNSEERSWKRSEFVRSLLSELGSDANIALICRVLDWREGPARIPEYFQPMFDQIRKGRRSRSWDKFRVADNFFEIDWDRFVEALEVLRPDKRPQAEWRQPDKYMYRTCFDSFCTFIQGVAEDVRSLGVAASEYADLSFYCHRIAFPLNQHRDLDKSAQAKIRAYIEHYYNKRTFDMMLVQAEVYALTHQEEAAAAPSDFFKDRGIRYPRLKDVVRRRSIVSSIPRLYLSARQALERSRDAQRVAKLGAEASAPTSMPPAAHPVAGVAANDLGGDERRVG